MAIVKNKRTASLVGGNEEGSQWHKIRPDMEEKLLLRTTVRCSGFVKCATSS